MNNVERFLEDISFNTKYTFLDEGKDKDELAEIAKKCRLILPCHDLAIFKGTYAYVDRQNKNGCTLPKEEVEKALDTLIGKAVDFDHFRKRVVGHWIDVELIKDEIIAYGVFFKGNFRDDYDDVKKLMEKDTLGVSFEAWGDKEMKTADTYDLTDIEFAGGGLLMQGEPAFDGTEVLEMSKERVLEFASVMKKPKSFVRSIDEKHLEEAYSCTCIKCGHKVNSDDTHCKDLKCPKCGGQMRRTERPGPGQGQISKEVEEVIAALPKEVTTCVSKKIKGGMTPAQAVKECWAEFKKQSKGQDKEEMEELTELAKFYIWDVQTIARLISDVECLSCKEKGYYNILVIDFANNTTKIKCGNCEAEMNVDLTPTAKLSKKGRKIKDVKMDSPRPAKKEEKSVFKEKDWLEVIETFEGSDDELEEAFMNEIEYDNGAVKLEGGKQLTYKERQRISDKMFAVVKIVKNKITGKPRKIRMFPIHDPAHVRNALARLPQATQTLKKLGVSIETVKRKILKRARELNMKDLLEKYEKSTVEEQAKLFQEVVEENAKLKVDAETKGTEITTLTETTTKKDEEMATLKTELDTVKKEAEEAKAEITRRDKEIKDAGIAKRREELGDLAKDMSDDDIMNDDKFKIVKLEKENTELKAKVEKADKDKEDPEKANKGKEDDDLDKGSKDKEKNSELFATQKRIDEKAWGKDDKKE